MQGKYNDICMMKFLIYFKYAFIGLFFIVAIPIFFFALGGPVIFLGGLDLVGKFIWMAFLALMVMAIIAPVIFAGITTFKHTRSLSKVIRDSIITFVIILLPYAVIFSFTQLRRVFNDRQKEVERQETRSDVLSWYVTTSPPQQDVPTNWKEYKWSTQEDSSSVYSIFFPPDWSISITDVVVLEFDGVHLMLSTDSLSDQIRTDGSEIEEANFYMNLQDPYYAFNRSNALLTTYKLENYPVYRAEEINKGGSLDVKKVIIFKKNNKVYEINARITSDSKERQTANIENVDRVFDSLIIY